MKPGAATTAQLMALASATDAKLMHGVHERLVRLAKKHCVSLRRSCAGHPCHACLAMLRPPPVAGSSRFRASA